MHFSQLTKCILTTEFYEGPLRMYRPFNDLKVRSAMWCFESTSSTIVSSATIGQCADVNNGYKRPSRYSCKKDFERKLKAQQVIFSLLFIVIFLYLANIVGY